jgi:hypothetical protein
VAWVQGQQTQPQGAVSYNEATGYYEDESGNSFQVDANNNFVPVGGTQTSSSGFRLFGPDSIADKIFNVDANKGTGPLSFLGKGLQQGANVLGGTGGLGGLASAGLGGFLGKLAYDAAKDRAGGLAVTPQVSMDALGRYQLASDLGTGRGTRGTVWIST